MRLGRTLLLVAAAALLAGCPKKQDPDDEKVEDLPPPTVRLQVAGIEPAFASAGRAFDAEVLGSGFERGARVALSGAGVEGVRYLDGHSLEIRVPSLAVGSYDVTVTNPDGTKSTLKKGLTLTEPREVPVGCSAVTIRFDFDSSVLSAASRTALDSFAPCIRDSGMDVRIEGHCDEQGTTDYNLALGQRRADAVQRYMVGLGVSPALLRTVSYGEERPADRSGSAYAFAQNRRAEIVPRE